MQHDEQVPAQAYKPPAMRRLITRLVLITIAMFGLGFALVPLYDLFCDVTGLNGKTNSTAFIPAAELVDTTREITVQFVATNNAGMPWEFRPEVFKLTVHPGAEVQTTFFARNPRRAAAYFHKTECFCFNQQALEGGASIDMPLSFIVDRDLPDNVNTITLSYTLFDVTDSQLGTQAGDVAVL